MDPRIEEILMARAIRDAESAPTTNEAITTGAMLGAVPGVVAGMVPNRIGNALNTAAGRGTKNIGRSLRPGFRAAGGLMGAILGGTLGAGTRQVMVDNSPAATLLAKAQAQGGLSAEDTRLLASVLEDTYQEMGLR
jgi:hypothetical protein